MIRRHADSTVAIARSRKNVLHCTIGNASRPSARDREIVISFGCIPHFGSIPPILATGTVPGTAAIIEGLATPAPPPRPQTGNRWRPALSPRVGRIDQGRGPARLTLAAGELAITPSWKRHCSDIACAPRSLRNRQEFPIGRLIESPLHSRHVSSPNTNYGRQDRQQRI
jgi:hypothetical protein